ncbi:MAG: glycosyltransferase, partial [Candidatus Aenigmarchaeota archaeon]|nr:glycosyltransferase [Candidatus Aenigmarchaeota archaeon]
LVRHNQRMRKVSIKKNVGYGYGVRKGIETSKGEYVGWLDADNQVNVKFVVDVFCKIKNSGFDIVAAKRITRNDGVTRRVASLFYNYVVALLFFTRMDDTNAKPKIFKKKAYMDAKIVSNDWFIDTELLLKFKARNYSVARVECISKERAHGASNVKIGTVLEFVKNIILFRAGLR